MEAPSRASTFKTTVGKLTVHRRPERLLPQERSWRFLPGLVYFGILLLARGPAGLSLLNFKKGDPTLTW